MMSQNFLHNLDRNKLYLGKIQDRLASGKILNRPSDDPVAVSRVMSLRTSIEEMEQFDRNMRDAASWLEASEAAMSNLTEVLQRARELAVYGAGGTLSDTAKEAIAKEVNELVKQAVQIANAVHGDSYIFGGTYTTKPPFELTEDEDRVLYKGDQAELRYEVSPGVYMPVNSSGKGFGLQVEGGEYTAKVFQTLIELRDRLRNGLESEISDILGDIDLVIDDVLSERATLGARINRMDYALDRNATVQLEYTKLISRLEDTDFARAMIDYSVQEATYQAALRTGAQLLQPTLLDFLK